MILRFSDIMPTPELSEHLWTGGKHLAAQSVDAGRLPREPNQKAA
jgi:hypothetical protein